MGVSSAPILPTINQLALHRQRFFSSDGRRASLQKASSVYYNSIPSIKIHFVRSLIIIESTSSRDLRPQVSIQASKPQALMDDHIKPIDTPVFFPVHPILGFT